MTAGNASATYGGNAMTKIVLDDYGSAFVIGFYIEEADLPSDGANNIIISHTSYIGDQISVYAGQLNNAEVDVANTNSDATAAISNTLSPTSDGAYIISSMTTSSSSATAISEDSSQNQLYEADEGGNRVSIAELEDVSSGRITLTSTTTPAHHLARIAMAFTPLS